MANNSLRAVFDTNVILSSSMGTETSPSKEIFEHWQKDDFSFLYSDDILEEYMEKLLHFGISESIIHKLFVDLELFAEHVKIRFYHHRRYPTDPDDIAFILCAANGNATDIVSYDTHLLDLHGKFVFDISKPLPFLRKLRATV